MGRNRTDHTAHPQGLQALPVAERSGRNPPRYKEKLHGPVDAQQRSSSSLFLREVIVSSSGVNRDVRSLIPPSPPPILLSVCLWEEADQTTQHILQDCRYYRLLGDLAVICPNTTKVSWACGRSAYQTKFNQRWRTPGFYLWLDTCTLCIPLVHTKTYGQRTFPHSAPTLWNNLPKAIRNSEYACSFFQKP